MLNGVTLSIIYDAKCCTFIVMLVTQSPEHGISVSEANFTLLRGVCTSVATGDCDLNFITLGPGFNWLAINGFLMMGFFFNF